MGHPEGCLLQGSPMDRLALLSRTGAIHPLGRDPDVFLPPESKKNFSLRSDCRLRLRPIRYSRLSTRPFPVGSHRLLCSAEPDFHLPIRPHCGPFSTV